MADKSVIWTFKLLLFFNFETFDRHSCKQRAFEESSSQSNLPITIKSTKLIATFIYINQQLVSALAAKDDFPSTKGGILIFIFIRDGLSILKLTTWNFLHRNASALSRQQHTCWRTWSPSLLILSGWLPVVNTELELTRMRSLQKLHRHVGPLPYLTEFKLFEKEHIFKCIPNFFFTCAAESQKVTKMSGRSWAQIKKKIRFSFWGSMHLKRCKHLK